MSNIEAMKVNREGQSRSNGSSNSAKLDYSASEVDPSPKITARALNDALAFCELDEIRLHYLALVMAVIELSQDAGLPAIWTHDDPTVALLRVAARLSLTHPDAESSAAAEFTSRLASGRS